MKPNAHSKHLVSLLKEHAMVMESMQGEAFMQQFQMAAEALLTALSKGNKILVIGNGGSAADAQHFAAELVCKFKEKRFPIPCIALTTDTSYITATANDYHFDDIFERQVRALGNGGDVLVAISTSGKSPNILKAIHSAEVKGIKVIGLSGKGGGEMRSVCPIFLHIESQETARVQEGHITTLHAFCEIIDNNLDRIPH